jgi:hypothetical protein
MLDTSSVLPFVLDETNTFLSPSLGPPKLNNVFGTALWVVDYMLYCAAIGISRIHMQQGTGFPYNSWQPIPLEGTPMDVYPPYYGNIAVATMLGNITADSPQIVTVDIPDSDDFESAYACYKQGSQLARVTVLNMHVFNITEDSASRQNRTYTFGVPSGSNIVDGHQVHVQRLLASGSDAMTGITFDGWSYQYGLNKGLPVKVGSKDEEMLTVKSGQVSVILPDSSAAILSF